MGCFWSKNVSIAPVARRCHDDLDNTTDDVYFPRPRTRNLPNRWCNPRHPTPNLPQRQRPVNRVRHNLEESKPYLNTHIDLMKQMQIIATSIK